MRIRSGSSLWYVWQRASKRARAPRYEPPMPRTTTRSTSVLQLFGCVRMRPSSLLSPFRRYCSSSFPRQVDEPAVERQQLRRRVGHLPFGRDLLADAASSAASSPRRVPAAGSAAACSSASGVQASEWGGQKAGVVELDRFVGELHLDRPFRVSDSGFRVGGRFSGARSANPETRNLTILYVTFRAGVNSRA